MSKISPIVNIIVFHITQPLFVQLIRGKGMQERQL